MHRAVSLHYHSLLVATLGCFRLTPRPRLRSTSSQRYERAAHTSEARWTFVLVCRTKSLEQSPVFTARTHRHQNFQTQTKDLSFSASLSLNLCSFIRSILFLFYFSTRCVIRWSILFCKRNSLWTTVTTLLTQQHCQITTRKVSAFDVSNTVSNIVAYWRQLSAKSEAKLCLKRISVASEGVTPYRVRTALRSCTFNSHHGIPTHVGHVLTPQSL